MTFQANDPNAGLENEDNGQEGELLAENGIELTSESEDENDEEQL